MEELVAHHPQKVFSLLLSLLKRPDEDPALRHLAAERLSQIDAARARKAFTELLDQRSEDPFARRAAMVQLAAQDQEDLRLKQRIRQILDDRTEDAAIRQYVLSLYSGWNEAGKIEKLRNFVRSKQETLSMRANAFTQLEHLEDTEFLLASARKFLNDRSEPEELRKQSLLVAQRSGDRELSAILKKIAQDWQESPGFRQQAESLLSSAQTGPDSTV